jgi:hypothetical protein
MHSLCAFSMRFLASQKRLEDALFKSVFRQIWLKTRMDIAQFTLRYPLNVCANRAKFEFHTVIAAV